MRTHSNAKKYVESQCTAGRKKKQRKKAPHYTLRDETERMDEKGRKEKRKEYTNAVGQKSTTFPFPAPAAP